MKISQIESFHLKIPYADPEFQGGLCDMLLLRVDTDSGLSGWGQAWSMCLADATKLAIDNSVAPMCIGQDAEAIDELVYRIKKTFGNTRHGPLTFVVSALDIAFWDLKGKRAGLPLHKILGETKKSRLPVYASLIQYSDPRYTAMKSREAVDKGYLHLKLHEREVAPVKACREEVGEDISVRLDPAWAWTREEAMAMVKKLEAFNLVWIEEPIWPPEDYTGLSQVAKETTTPLAAGENCISHLDFHHLWESGAATYLQPSIIKIGGVSEILKVMEYAKEQKAPYVPHCFYYGPGFLASLHMAALWEEEAVVEFPYFGLEAYPFGDNALMKDGMVDLPNAPGLGFDPDPEFLKAYSI
jgi:L-alanine-DL-glutamate epimerase-like enolase superfamily enzyme